MKTKSIVLIYCIFLVLLFFQFYIFKYLSFFILFNIVIIIIFFILAVFVFTFQNIKNKKYKNLVLLFIPLILVLNIFLNIKYGFSEKIALFIEMPRIENKVEKYLQTGIKYKTQKIDGDLIAFSWFSGVTDNWSAVVFDNTGTLEKGIEYIMNNKNYFNSQEYNGIKKLFGGDIQSIKKIKDNYYLCIFT